MRNLSNKKFTVLFVIFTLLSTSLLFHSYNEVIGAHAHAKLIIKQQQTKHRLITKMYMAARERSLILLTMHAEYDDFELDELSQNMREQASSFIKAREELESMSMGAGERAIFNEQQELVKIYASMQNQVSELFIEGKRARAEKIMFEGAIPGQRLVLDKVSEMLDLYENNAVKVVAGIDKSSIEASRNFQILWIALISVATFFILGIMYMSRREQRKLQCAADEMSYLASHDPLTGLSNRWAFENQLLQLEKEESSTDVSFVLYLDLDQFKIVNDTCGHNAGDDLLKRVATILQSCIRETDMVARIGGDEFGLILLSCEYISAKATAKSIIQALNEYRFCRNKKKFRVGASIGMVRVANGSGAVEDIMLQIDSACYAAKDAGGNRYHLYSNSDLEIMQRKSEMSWVVHMERALENDKFVLYTQPIVSIVANDEPINYEILLRMKADDGSIISPNAFLPAAERYNKMIAIDKWVIRNTFSILSGNQHFLQDIGYASINISCQSLADEGFLSFVLHQFRMYKRLANKICFEITETAAISNPLKANQCITILRGMGVRFALDDFGSGLASFEYLKTLPIDYLKIDGMFVKDIMTDPIDRAMVKSIHEIAKVMNKKTIAEYVENEEILNELKEIGVEYAQGYHVGKPLTLHAAINSYTRLVKVAL